MRKHTDTRQALIDQGLKALLTNGYDGVGLGAILAAAQVPKGSFYHFFASKEDFAVAILDAYERHYIGLRASILGDHAASPFRRLEAYFDELERIHAGEQPLGGCLFGVLAQTAGARSPAFRARLAAIFAEWARRLHALLVEAKAEGEIEADLDVAEAAAFIIEAYEGALVRMKVDGGSAAFARFKRFALGSLRARPLVRGAP